MPRHDRHYIVGDIHGNNEALQRLLSILDEQLNPEDCVIFLGDYIDRGPDSKGVIDTLLSYHYKQPCYFIEGNHEEMLLSYFQDPVDVVTAWNIANNGGQATARSYGKNQASVSDSLTPEDLPRSHYIFLTNLLVPYVVINEHVLCVHGGIRNVEGATTVHEVLDETPDHFLYWDRRTARSPNTFGTIIVGHTPTDSHCVEGWHPREDDTLSAIRVDTGPAYPIAALCFETEKVFYSDGTLGTVRDNIRPETSTS